MRRNFCTQCYGVVRSGGNAFPCGLVDCYGSLEGLRDDAGSADCDAFFRNLQKFVGGNGVFIDMSFASFDSAYAGSGWKCGDPAASAGILRSIGRMSGRERAEQLLVLLKISPEYIYVECHYL